MKARLTQIHRDEVLLYLGYKGGDITEEVSEQIETGIQLVMQKVRPRLTYRCFDYTPDCPLPNTKFSLCGNDIREMLKDCHRVVLMAATLGSESDALFRRYQLSDMAMAAILDCCGSSAIENVCDNFCEDLQAEMEPFYLTDRFSPGYGDMPFSQQFGLSEVLDLPRSLGVCLSSGGLMIPQKSVTAVIGIAETPQPKRFRGCAHCSHFYHCTYRKEGKHCGNF